MHVLKMSKKWFRVAVIGDTVRMLDLLRNELDRSLLNGAWPIWPQRLLLL